MCMYLGLSLIYHLLGWKCQTVCTSESELVFRCWNLVSMVIHCSCAPYSVALSQTILPFSKPVEKRYRKWRNKPTVSLEYLRYLLCVCAFLPPPYLSAFRKLSFSIPFFPFICPTSYYHCIYVPYTSYLPILRHSNHTMPLVTDTKKALKRRNILKNKKKSVNCFEISFFRLTW